MNEEHGIYYNPGMDTLIGTEVKVVSILKHSIRVKFKDESRDWDYRSLEKVEDVPVFYKTGDTFSRKDCDDTYILVTNSTTACLANMETGYTWNGFKQVTSTLKINKKEFTSAFGTDFTKIE